MSSISKAVERGEDSSAVPDPEGSQTPASYWALFAAVCFLLLLPVLLVSYVQLVDYPSHLARAYVLAHYKSVPLYQQNYVVAREILPNLAADLILTPLLKVFGLQTASRIFLSTTILLFAFGCHLLGRASCGYSSKRAVLCAFFVYNSMLFYGFVNYVFGLGMFCVSLAVWLQWRNRWTFARCGSMLLLVLLTYLAHLTAYAFLGIAFGVIGLFDYGRDRNWGGLLAMFGLLVPEAIVFVVFRHANNGGASWGTLTQKITGFFPLLLTYSYSFDIGFSIVLLGLLVYGIRHVKLLAIDKPIFVAGLVFLVLELVAPHEWLGGSPVDARFIPPAVLLIIFSLRTRLLPSARFLFAATLLIFSVRLLSVARTWQQLSTRVEGQMELFQALPEGARLYPLLPPTQLGSTEAKTDRAFEHAAEYAVIERHAFVPTQLAVPGQEILLFRTARPYKRTFLKPSLLVATMQTYDFVWSHRTSPDQQRALEEACDLIAQRDGFSMWRVRKLPATETPAPVK